MIDTNCTFTHLEQQASAATTQLPCRRLPVPSSVDPTIWERWGAEVISSRKTRGLMCLGNGGWSSPPGRSAFMIPVLQWFIPMIPRTKSPLLMFKSYYPILHASVPHVFRPFCRARKLPNSCRASAKNWCHRRRRRLRSLRSWEARGQNRAPSMVHDCINPGSPKHGYVYILYIHLVCV